jgi:hypothetical protein
MIFRESIRLSTMICVRLGFTDHAMIKRFFENGLVHPDTCGGIGLWVAVHQQGPLFRYGKGGGEIDRRRGLSHAPFLIGNA